jgi:DNA processing protein
VTNELEARVAWATIGDPLDLDAQAHVARLGAERALDALRTAPRLFRRGSTYTARLAGFEAAGGAPAILQRTEQVRARVVVPGDVGWPRRLDDLGLRRPFALWVRGPGLIAEGALPSAALVGARAATRYGEQVAADLAADVAGRGWAVVSGAAYGIDAAAHRGALAVGGCTVAVVATGVDEHYPRGNDALLARIGDEGAIVTELPPGTRPTRAGFLARNRLIAALAHVVVVVEAAVRSGSAATVARAVELGREICAVPGPVTSATSVGAHALLRDGATLVTCGADVVEAAGPWLAAAAAAEPASVDARDALSRADRSLLDAFPARTGADEATLARRSGLAAAEVPGRLARLLADGWVERGADGWRLAAMARSASPRS